MFTFTGRISAKRKAPDAVVFDEGIAPAISEEKNTADGRLAAGRKLTVKVNMARTAVSRFNDDRREERAFVTPQLHPVECFEA